MRGRRRSTYRYRSRVSSLTASSSSWNGGVRDSFSTSMVFASTSTRPVVSSRFSVPSGRKRTLPATRRTYSLRARSASANASGVSRVDDDLEQAGTVPEVDEDDPPVIPAAGAASRKPPPTRRRAASVTSPQKCVRTWRFLD